MQQERTKGNPSKNLPRSPRRIFSEVPGKLPELAECPRCGASYRNGRWTWRRAPVGAYEAVCPACERIEANYPAGVLHARGSFARENRPELVRLLENLEDRERSDHPLKRIISISEEDDGFSVTVTDAKLALTFGRALEKAYAGRLDQPGTTSDVENLVRVQWTRDTD